MSISSSLAALKAAKTNIAQAIINKGGTINEEDGFLDFPSAIQNIPTTAIADGDGDYRIRFIDYDGKIIHTTYVNAGESVTPPNSPDRTGDGLTFQEWNYSTEEMSNIQRDMDIGASYITTDGKTHVKIILTAVSGLSHMLYMSKSDSSELCVDWGDNTPIDSFNISGSLSIPHIYSAYGKYTIKIWNSNNAEAYKLGQGSNRAFFGGSTLSQNQCLSEVFLGNGKCLNTYSFLNCHSLKHITIPVGLNTINDYCFNNCRGLLHVSIPRGTTSIGTNSFKDCYTLRTISIPESISNIGASAFNLCRILKDVYLPNNISTLNTYTFGDCYGLESIHLPTGLKYMGTNLFDYNFNMKTTVIPANVTVIESYAFRDHTAKVKYVCLPINPPTLGSSAFIYIPSTTKIFVPDNSLTSYKTATNWVTYSNYIYPMSQMEE